MVTQKRKSLSKKARFEVFKRDSFTCQYCGAHPPTVVLHVDHINPVANGGDNEQDNLVTSCDSCNQGKSDRLLSDVPQSLKDKASRILEREAQIKGYQLAMDSKRKRIEGECNRVVDVYERFNAGYTLSERALISVRYFIDKIGVHEVVKAMEISLTTPSVSKSKQFRYFCGICWNRIRENEQ